MWLPESLARRLIFSGSAGFSIEGPSQAKIECDDKGDGSCDVRYWPTEPGDYAVHVICDDEDIKDSPFIAHILPAANDIFPEKVRPSTGRSGCTALVFHGGESASNCTLCPLFTAIYKKVQFLLASC